MDMGIDRVQVHLAYAYPYADWTLIETQRLQHAIMEDALQY